MTTMKELKPLVLTIEEWIEMFKQDNEIVQPEGLVTCFLQHEECSVLMLSSCYDDEWINEGSRIKLYGLIDGLTQDRLVAIINKEWDACSRGSQTQSEAFYVDDCEGCELASLERAQERGYTQMIALTLPGEGESVANSLAGYYRAFCKACASIRQRCQEIVNTKDK